MIELPIWVFVLMCILSAPILIVIVFIILVLLMTPFYALRSASLADEALGIKEVMPNFENKEKE